MTCPGPPQHSDVIQDLKALKGLKQVITSEALRDNYALLLLPFYVPDDDWDARRALFMEALRHAIQRVEQRDHKVILTHTFLHQSKLDVGVREENAADELDITPSAVRAREAKAIESLAKVLSSDAFVAAFNHERGIEVGPIDVDDHGLGYIFREKTMRLIIDPEDERRQRYIDHYHIVATRPGVRVIANRFRWTGTDTEHPAYGDQSITTQSLGHSYLGTRIEHQMIGPPRPLNFFHLGKLLEVNERADLSYSWDLLDDGGKFDRHLLAYADNADMEHVTAELDLPRHKRYKVEAGEFEYRAFALEPTGPRSIIEPNADGLYVFRKDAPREQLYYGVTWADEPGER